MVNVSGFVKAGFSGHFIWFLLCFVGEWDLKVILIYVWGGFVGKYLFILLLRHLL